MRLDWWHPLRMPLCAAVAAALVCRSVADQGSSWSSGSWTPELTADDYASVVPSTLALTLPVDFETVRTDDAAMQSFKLQIRQVLAGVMGVSLRRVYITSVRAGSLVLEFGVSPPEADAASAAKPTAEAVAVLTTLMLQPASVIEGASAIEMTVIIIIFAASRTTTRCVMSSPCALC